MDEYRFRLIIGTLLCKSVQIYLTVVHYRVPSPAQCLNAWYEASFGGKPILNGTNLQAVKSPNKSPGKWDVSWPCLIIFFSPEPLPKMTSTSRSANQLEAEVAKMPSPSSWWELLTINGTYKLSHTHDLRLSLCIRVLTPTHLFFNNLREGTNRCVLVSWMFLI